jgi:pimeloyl-ACP methyl ester carboxylesterase
VLHGSDDRLTPVANAELLAGRVPGAVLRVLRSARHGYLHEYRSEATDLVLDVIRRHPLP